MTTKTSSKKGLGKRILQHWPLYVMLAPCLIFFILFSYIPISGNVIAFKDYKFNEGIYGSEWIGFDYFITFFQSYDCWRLIKNTLVLGFMKCILEFPFAIILALMINEVRHTKFKKVTQTISYLPHFLSWVIVATIIQRILAPDTGLVNQIIGAFGGDPSTFFLMEEEWFRPIVFLSDIWKNIGWGSIIYLAAIAGVDPTLYEAAEVDGCGKFRQIFAITLPSIANTAAILFIIGVGGILNAGFDQIYLLQTPGNKAVSDTLDTFVVLMGLTGGQYSYAAAVGLFQAVIGFTLVFFTNRMSRKFSEVSIW